MNNLLILNCTDADIPGSCIKYIYENDDPLEPKNYNSPSGTLPSLMSTNIQKDNFRQIAFLKIKRNDGYFEIVPTNGTESKIFILHNTDKEVIAVCKRSEYSGDIYCLEIRQQNFLSLKEFIVFHHSDAEHLEVEIAYEEVYSPTSSSVSIPIRCGKPILKDINPVSGPKPAEPKPVIKYRIDHITPTDKITGVRKLELFDLQSYGWDNPAPQHGLIGVEFSNSVLKLLLGKTESLPGREVNLVIF